MIPKHAIFATRDLATTAASDGLDALTASMTAATVAALPASEQATAGPSPLVTGRVISATPLPMGALPTTATAYSEVEWEMTTTDGKTERCRSRVPTASLPQPTKSNGQCTALATVYPTIRVKATLPKEIQFQCIRASTAVGDNLPIGTTMVDVVSGKRFQTDAPLYPLVLGPNTITVVETDANEVGEATHGTTLLMTAPALSSGGLVQVLPIAVVQKMTNVGIAFESLMTDAATGRIYYTVSAGPFASTVKLAGDTTLDITFHRVTNDPLYIGDGTDLHPSGDMASLEAGTVLTFTPAISGVALYALSITKANVTLPAGTPLRRATNAKNYKSTAQTGRSATANATDIPDSMKAQVFFEADLVETASDIPVGAVLAFNPVISGVTANATVTDAADTQLYPVDFPARVVGAELTLRSDVKQEIYGGQWSATLQAETEVDG